MLDNGKYKIHSCTIEVDEGFDPSRDFDADAVHAFAWHMLEEKDYNVVAPSLHLEHNFTLVHKHDFVFQHTEIYCDEMALLWLKEHGDMSAFDWMVDAILKYKQKNPRDPLLRFIFNRYGEPLIVDSSLEPFLKESSF